MSDVVLAAMLREHGREALAAQLGAASDSDVDLASAYAEAVADVSGDPARRPDAHHGALAVLRSASSDSAGNESLAGVGEEQFVALAHELGALFPAEVLLAVGRAAAVFAAAGSKAFHSWLVTSIEPRAETPQLRKIYANILSAAGIKLCPQHLDVLQPEIQRLAGN